MPDRPLFALGTLLFSATLLFGQAPAPEGNCVGLLAASSSLGPGCGNPTPNLFASPPVLGGAVFAMVSSSFPSAPTYVYMSIGSHTPVHLGWVTNCTIYVDLVNSANFFVIAQGFTDATGTLMLPLHRVPNDPSLHGLQLTIQAEVWDGTGPVFGDHLTNGILLTVGC